MRQVFQNDFILITLFFITVTPDGKRNRKATFNLEELITQKNEALLIFEILVECFSEPNIRRPRNQP